MAGAVLAAGLYGLVMRPWHLHWGATAAEADRPMPGDDLVPHPQLEATRAITIAAPPAAVWPWLSQTAGATWRGWHGYDTIDDADRPSADHISPDLRHLEAGDVLPTHRDGAGIEVRAIDPERTLVATTDDMDATTSLTATLEPRDHEGTRLVLRLRIRAAPTWRGRLFLTAMDVGDFVRMRHQLIGIRERAEHAYRRDPPQARSA